jgi:threonine aldolase
MRQAGVIASAGVYSLKNSIARLSEDHETARRLAAGLCQLPGLKVDRDEVQTNIFFVDIVSDRVSAAEFAAGLRAGGVLVNPPRTGSRTVRFVTHDGITTSDIDAALAVATRVLNGADAMVDERVRYEAAVS